MPTSLDQLLRYCQETHGNSASLSEISKKKKRNEKKLHAGCRCSVRHQRKKASRASRHRPPASLPTHVLIMSPCLQLRKHTSASYSTLCDWYLAGSQPLENGSRSCHKRKSDGGLGGGFLSVQVTERSQVSSLRDRNRRFVPSAGMLSGELRSLPVFCFFSQSH